MKNSHVNVVIRHLTKNTDPAGFEHVYFDYFSKRANDENSGKNFKQHSYIWMMDISAHLQGTAESHIFCPNLTNVHL
jgi:hypothetical protein